MLQIVSTLNLKYMEVLLSKGIFDYYYHTRVPHRNAQHRTPPHRQV